jgi:DNA-3-methyladenine glycosylase I
MYFYVLRAGQFGCTVSEALLSLILEQRAKINRMTTISKTNPTVPLDLSLARCAWCEGFDAYRHYHDTEWGVPMLDDRALFEKLCLEAMQAGLSWATVLKKREHFRQAFDGFEIDLVAAYDHAKVEQLLTDPGIIRNRAKVLAVVGNAKAMQVHFPKHHNFRDFLWAFVDGKPIQRKLAHLKDAIGQDERSQAMSKALLAKGFKFVGPTICYSLMQSTGMVNDHVMTCFRYAQLGGPTTPTPGASS